MALSLLKLMTKSGICGGVVYLSVEQGVWGTTQRSVDICKTISDSTPPAVKQYTDRVPKRGEVSNFTSGLWNCGVFNLFQKLTIMPEYIGKGFNSGIEMAINAVKSSMQ